MDIDNKDVDAVWSLWWPNLDCRKAQMALAVWLVG